MKKGKTLSQLKKIALDTYSELVKARAERDGNLKCFTCDSPLQNHTSNCQLGHFLSRGGYPGLTFHPDNSRPQCYRCNIHLKGNTIEFRIRLIEKIGVNRVEALENKRHESVKLSRMDYIDMVANFKAELHDINHNL